MAPPSGILFLLFFLDSQTRISATFKSSLEPHQCTSSLQNGASIVTFSNKHIGPREAYVYVPSNLSDGARAPLVMFFHGWTNSCRELGSGCSDSQCWFHKLAEARGFIFASVCGIDGSFNAGNCCPPASSADHPTNDVAAARRLVRKLQHDACVDPDRIYAAGYSNGGMMVHRLACEAADVFKAVASVAGTSALPADPIAHSPCRSAYARLGNSSHGPPPISILSLHGSEDVYVPYNGSMLLGLQPVGDTMQAWASMQSCSPGPSRVISHSGRMRTSSWANCSGGKAILQSMLVEGVAHEWIVSKRLGIHASEVVLDFFDRAAVARGVPVDTSIYTPLAEDGLWPAQPHEEEGAVVQQEEVKVKDPLAEGLAALAELFSFTADGEAASGAKHAAVQGREDVGGANIGGPRARRATPTATAEPTPVASLSEFMSLLEQLDDAQQVLPVQGIGELTAQVGKETKGTGWREQGKPQPKQVAEQAGDLAEGLKGAVDDLIGTLGKLNAVDKGKEQRPRHKGARAARG